ncbi:MAG: hypothetical protein FWD31_01790 [Planctomycetaceae bacterium]|nr:hypothetical protein [Planctomycetaceae bacterium]
MERVVGAAVCDLADAAGSRGVLLSLRRVQQHRANETRTSHPFRRAMGDGQWREGRGERREETESDQNEPRCQVPAFEHDMQGRLTRVAMAKLKPTDASGPFDMCAHTQTSMKDSPGRVLTLDDDARGNMGKRTLPE